jgi:excisionase family DNA binding protein
MGTSLAAAEEVAQFLQVPVRTLYEWNYKGTGPRVLKVGRHLRYRWSDVEKWLDAQTRTEVAP